MYLEIGVVVFCVYVVLAFAEPIEVSCDVCHRYTRPCKLSPMSGDLLICDHCKEASR